MRGRHKFLPLLSLALTTLSTTLSSCHSPIHPSLPVSLRWGDAPVHSIAVAMFLHKSEVHFFNDIGYRHTAYMHCPTDPKIHAKCKCDETLNHGTFDGWSARGKQVCSFGERLLLWLLTFRPCFFGIDFDPGWSCYPQYVEAQK